MSAEIAQELNAELSGRPADVILARALEVFGKDFALVSSFGAESAVLLALAADIDRSIPVLFLDTGFHFPQTLQHRDTLVRTLGLTDVRALVANETDRLAEDPGNTLWQTSTDACCDLRKVRPLDLALTGFTAWGTGRKRWQNAIRSTMETVEWDGQHIKVNPLADWTAEDIARFSADRTLPAHPMVDMGYSSIGCWPCTKATNDGEDQRAGRWAGQTKTECGIHLRRPTATLKTELADA